MATIALTNVPDDLLRRLEEAAAVEDRDVGAEAVERLDQSLRVPLLTRSHQELSELARAVRVSSATTSADVSSPDGWLTPAFIRAAREWGRR